MNVLQCDLCRKVDDGSGVFARLVAVTFGGEPDAALVPEEAFLDICEDCLGQTLLRALLAGRKPLSLETATRLAMDERHD